jgi:L,D-transpeptidase catalytic domain
MLFLRMMQIQRFIFLLFLIVSCGPKKSSIIDSNAQSDSSNGPSGLVNNNNVSLPDSVMNWFEVTKDVKVKEYFKFMDKLVVQVDTFETWHINEYILAHANSWIIDSLKSFDYYQMMEKGRFVYDQTELIILRKGDSLAIPDSAYAARIQAKLSTTIIDVNLPEFKLRLIQQGDTILTIPVRVGRDAEKFLYVVGRVVNLRTPIGVGEIVRTDRMHKVINLNTGKEYPGTNRDDGKFTKMPIIPWIEPSINGIRYGAMIHPTTNPTTLGKAYSHGCIGTKEADAWDVYYNSPVGTKVIFRYDLQIIDEKGDTILLEDIYHLAD